MRNGILTIAMLPKRFIDATNDPDPYQDAIDESQTETIQ